MPALYYPSRNPFGVAILCLLLHTAAGSAEVPVILDHQLLQPSDPGSRIRAVAIDDNTIVLGAPFDSGLGHEVGAVYVFERPPSGHWVQTARLQPAGSTRPCMHFGRAVDVQGDVILANQWNWLFYCEAEPAPSRTARLHAFARTSAGWTHNFGFSGSSSHGLDIGFDGISALVAHESYGATALTRLANGSWQLPPATLNSIGMMFNEDGDAGLLVDIHDGLAAIGGSYVVQEPTDWWERPAATLLRRNGTGTWQFLTDLYLQVAPEMRGQSKYIPAARVALGPRQRVALNESVFEPDVTGTYVPNADLRPVCSRKDVVHVDGYDALQFDVEFDENTALAVVRTRPWAGFTDSLWQRGVTLHLYRRISAGNWEVVAQLIAGDNTPANVGTDLYYDSSFAIDSDVVISNKRVWSSATPKAPSYQFSNVDPCLGHRGNWIELTPKRWSISTSGGVRSYGIVTSDYQSRSVDRPGEYALINHHQYTDFDFSMKARSNENLVANAAADYVVVFAYLDEFNFSYMMFSRYAANNELFKVVSGVRHSLGRAPRASFLDNGWHKVDIQRRGSEIKVLFDGRTYLTANDEHLYMLGAIGIGSYNDSASFDDIVVKEYPR